jgi:hypothetical protein
MSNVSVYMAIANWNRHQKYIAKLTKDMYVRRYNKNCYKNFAAKQILFDKDVWNQGSDVTKTGSVNG